MITVHAQFHSHFKEIASTGEATFELESGSVAELAKQISARYGPKMHSILIDSETNELNERGTMFVDSQGRRISIEDQLDEGETITFMVGIAGG